MKIGIYGDSYANTLQNPSMVYHWSTIIKNKLDATVVNYGVPGTSVYFTYKKFLSTYQNHDLNIVIITEPNRYIKTILGLNQGAMHITGIGALDAQKNNIDDKTYNDLLGWFMSSCENYNSDMSDLMVEKMLKLDGNALIIPAFEHSINKQTYKLLGLDKALWQVHKYQSAKLGIKWNHAMSMGESEQLIAGHFTPELNEIVADIILKKIETGVWDWTLPETVSFHHSITDYYKL